MAGQGSLNGRSSDSAGVVRAIARFARASLPPALAPSAKRAATRLGLIPPEARVEPPLRYPFSELLGERTHPHRPHYYWGTLCAAAAAAYRGHDRISVIEFGVAGGNGLLTLEQIAVDVGSNFGIAIDVVGFDTGTGLSPPVDYRDSPHLWSEGDFCMDFDRLRRRLNTARLILGPVAETVPAFLAGAPAPIGFIAFDLDLYSSTVDAFQLFEADEALLLPRVTCYFDDIVGFSHCDYTGERLAIVEFSRAHESRKISPIYGLRHILGIDEAWTHMMYMFHDFAHSQYNEPDGTNRLRELRLHD